MDNTLACDVGLECEHISGLYLHHADELCEQDSRICPRDEEDNVDTKPDYIHGFGEARNPEVFRATRSSTGSF